MNTCAKTSTKCHNVTMDILPSTEIAHFYDMHWTSLALFLLDALPSCTLCQYHKNSWHVTELHWLVIPELKLLVYLDQRPQTDVIFPCYTSHASWQHHLKHIWYQPNHCNPKDCSDLFTCHMHHGALVIRWLTWIHIGIHVCVFCLRVLKT